MYKLIKMTPLIAIALIVYGIIRFDWIAVLLGLILFIMGFVFHVIKRRNVTSGDFFHVYQEIYDLISNIDKTIDNVLIDYPEPKIKLIKGVYYIGIIDCACDSDEKFLKIANAILDDMIFNKNERKHLIQSRTDFDYEVCQILLEGADLFRNVSEGDRAKIRDIPKVVKKFADNKEVPNSISELGQLINTLRVKADSPRMKKKRKPLSVEEATTKACTRWQDFMAEMSEQPFDVLKTVTIKTTIYYLELKNNYCEQFKDEASLLAAAGVLDAQHYICVDEKINVPEIIDIARASAEQDDGLTDFVTSLVIRIFQVYTPEKALAAKRACLEEKTQTLADVVQIRKQYKHDPFIAKEVSAFMESPNFSETRNQLGIR